jgi:hypothetical protein
MQHCNEGDKPTVRYKFGNGGYRQFKSDYSPIDVTVKSVPIPNTDNYNGVGYRINFYSPNNFTTVEAIVTDHYTYVIESETNPDSRYGITWINCGDTAFQGAGNPYPGVNFRPSSLIIDTTVNCPSSQQKNSRCSIIVTHEGVTIFQDQGDCPIEHEVQCGNCPDGNIECKKSGYPGYCCIPCEELANKIHNLANKVR